MVLFLCDTPESDRRACTGGHPTGRSPYKKEEQKGRATFLRLKGGKSL